MGQILALGLAAAVYPQLLAVVVVILTRERPRLLLWACYLGSMLVSVAAGISILAVFRSRGTVAGTTSSRLGPATYMTVGVLALGVAVFAATPRGRELLGSGRLSVSLRRGHREPGSTSRLRARAERALKDGSLPIAFVIGGVLGVPGPFDLLALGHLARDEYGWLVDVVAVVAFNLIKFVLIEIPIVGYALRPERTAAEVARFAAWMHAHKVEVLGLAVGVVSLVLIGRGIAGLS